MILNSWSFERRYSKRWLVARGERSARRRVKEARLEGMLNSGGIDLNDQPLPPAASSGSSAETDRARPEPLTSQNVPTPLVTEEGQDTVPKKPNSTTRPPLVPEPGRDSVHSLAPSTTVPRSSAVSVGPLDRESAMDGDISFLEECCEQRIHTFTFGVALSFAGNPGQMHVYEHVDIEDPKNHNSGPHALDSQVSGNAEFLEHEDWLSMLYSTVSAITTPSLSPENQERCSRLLATLRQEWVRMQLYKEREWIRQQDMVVSLKRTGTPFLDSRMYPASPWSTSIIDVQGSQVATSGSHTSRTPLLSFITSRLYCFTSFTKCLVEQLAFFWLR